MRNEFKPLDSNILPNNEYDINDVKSLYKNEEFIESVLEHLGNIYIYINNFNFFFF